MTMSSSEASKPTADSDLSQSDVTPFEFSDQSFWNEYVAGRPHLPDSFFQRIFDFHAANADGDGGWGTLHDAGAGAAIHTPRLAPRFERVIITDPGEGNLALARKRLEGLDDSGIKGKKRDFLLAKLEESGQYIADGSVDLVFASTMLHFCDLGAALTTVHRQLRPGGTLAIALCVFAIHDDPALRTKWRQLLHVHHDAAYRRLQGEWGDETFLHALRLIASGYDAVPIPEELFQPGALRLRFEENGEYGRRGSMWFDMMATGELEEKCQIASEVGPHDQIVSEAGGGEWRWRMDCQGLKTHLKTLLINFDEPEVAKQWAEFEEMAAGRTMTGRWPARLILATRK